MQILTDCEILEYCHSTPEERQAEFQRAADNENKPVFQLPVFELCHALHLLVKHHGVSPKQFRLCWAGLSEKHLEAGEYFIHVPEHAPAYVLFKIAHSGYELPADGTAPCEDAAIYWGHNRHLIHRMKRTYDEQVVLPGWWVANLPDGRREPPTVEATKGQDIVLDTNNFIELINQLPPDGFTLVADINFPTRLSDEVRKILRDIINSRGGAGKFIIPITVFEEAEWVINKPANVAKYKNARDVLYSIVLDNDNLLWNLFSFETMDQEIFECFVFLYERLESVNVDFNDFDDFGDLLILAHGLYHGCKIASNEWFEGKTDVWDLLRGFFPYLAVEKE